MKKYIIALICVSLIACSVACGKDTPGESTSFSTDVATSEATEKKESTTQAQSGESSSSPEPAPMDKNKVKPISICGKNTGTKETFTGYEPLPKVQLPVVDPQNLRKLSEKEYNHSYGVSTGGVPHEISVNNQKFYEKYGGICLDTSGEKVIYLTFDCGYENGCTEKILDTLKEKNVKAIFFVTLSNVKANPELIARMIKEGHVVGNHSDSHPNFSKITRVDMAREIQNLDNYLREKFGYSSNYFRFPEGACSENALELVESVGFTSVFWSSAYADWDVSNPKGKDYAFQTVTSRLHPGCVLLLHAVSHDNADALGDIIDYAFSQGYKFRLI